MHKRPVYTQISNAYATNPAFAADPPEPDPEVSSTSPLPDEDSTLRPVPSKFRRKAERRRKERAQRRQRADDEEALLDHHITWAEDERTVLAKNDQRNPRKLAIDLAHTGPP